MPDPTCEGFGTHHKPVVMELVGLEDDGGHLWECPKCLYARVEVPEAAALSRKDRPDA